MLMETILTSVPPEADCDPIVLVARESHAGLVRLLETEYGLRLSGGRWLPAEELSPGVLSSGGRA
jgi:hypothetical protein